MYYLNNIMQYWDKFCIMYSLKYLITTSKYCYKDDIFYY